MKTVISFYTAFKRVLKNPLFLFMLAFLCFCVLFFGSIEKQVTIPKTGVTLIDTDPEAQSLYERLCADGFIPYENESVMCEAIRTGEIAMGVSVNEGLTGRMKAGDMEGATKLFCTPTTSFITVTSLRISAHLGDIYAPYLTERMMQSYGITLTNEQVREYMDTCYAEDAQFEFVFSDMDGKPLERASYSQSLIFGMLAVLLFCLFALCTCTEKDESYRNLHDRLGARRAFFGVLLPSYAAKYAVCLAVTGGACYACHLIYGTDVSSLFGRCALYLFFLMGVGALLYAVLYYISRVQLVVMIVSVMSLGICPIFVDLGFYAKIPEFARMLLPPYFFYKIPTAPVLSVAVACGLFAVSLLLLYLREKSIKPKTKI